MKRFNAAEIVLIIFAGSIGLVIILAVLGMVIKGQQATEANVVIRTALIDLLKVIAGGVLGVLGTLKSQKQDT